MGVTIDSLQIEIQSSSTNAAKGIDALAKSLEGLKKNGSFKTVSTNLNNLSAALNKLPNVHHASNALRTLANSIEKLKSVGTVSSLSNSLKKLPESLKSLGSIDLTKAEENIRGVADAVYPLTQVKNSGFSSMVNSMGKLKSVTDSLDTETLDKFAEKIKKLDSIVEPFATKMGTIKTALGGINTQIKQTNVSVEKANANVHVSIFNLSNLVNVISTVHSALTHLIQGFSNIVHAASEWDGIAARFGRGFGTQAQDTYAWIQRLNDEMGINVQQAMQHSSIYANMLTGFGVVSEDAYKMALGYTELTYDIWAGYNDIYKSYEEAAEAIRSAIAGEVEPIRRAGFTIIESTLEQTAANHGLNISIENATEAQKSYLRYLTLVDQAHSQNLVGTYAKELNTAEGLMRTFSQQLKSLTQAFGSLFLPILVKVMPWFQAFVELLTDGVQAIAAMFGITIQGVDWSDYNSGASDAVENTEGITGALNDATQAAKELKNASIGIDELNVISPSSATGGNGTGGGAGGSGSGGFDGLDIDSLWDESILKDINNQIDNLKETLKGWLPVIATIGAGFAAWSLLSLIESAGEAMVKLSEMEGKIGVLKKALVGLTILTIEAVLVFALSDEYLESGNLMALLGETLATAAGGYLMYKGFGPKGLVMSLAVSMIAQLVAITMNLADGGVEFDDPQLWIQSAFTTALGGAAGGYLAYKGMIPVSKGKGVGLGLLVGLSLTLAAITIGETSANGELTTASILTGLGSVLAAAGFGFTVGGPWGALIGAVVGLTVNVVGAVVGMVSKDAEKSLEEDLSDRFGNVELSISEIRVMIEKLSPEWVGTVIEATELREGVEALDKEIEKQLSTLNKLEWKISVGLGLSEDEEAQYQRTIESFIATCQHFIDERSYALVVGLTATGLPQSIIDSVETVTKMADTELNELGKQLQETINAAYEDGLLDIDELKAIQNIRKDMLEIVNTLKSSEIAAEFNVLEMKWSGVDLTTESYQTMMNEWNNTIKNDIKPALEATVKENLKSLEGNVAFAKLQLDKDPTDKAAQQALADAEKALQDYMDSNPLSKLTLDANVKAVTFGLNTLQEAFAAEIARAESEGWLDFEIQLGNVEAIFGDGTYLSKDGSTYAHLNALAVDVANQMMGAMSTSTEKLSKETRKNLEELLKALEPTMADYEKIAKTSRKSGTTVTSSIREGLNDYNELKALSGDADAINYLIGQSFSTDTTFLNTLATVKNAGKQIDASVAEGLLNNIDYVTDEATGLVTGIKNSVTGEVTAVTPTLKENMKQMGVDLSTGLSEGVEDEKPSLWEKFKSWGGGIIDWVKDIFDTHSPSKVFEEIGGDLSDGLGNGLDNNSFQESLSNVWSDAKTWWDNNKGNLGTYTPSIGNISTKLSSAWESAKTWWNEKKGALKTYTPSIGSIYEKLKERWDSARSWWNDKKTKAKEYTPSIGSIYEKLYDKWKNARDWWNNKKGSMSYTPSIGSIVDKVKSAWNSAKSWWSKNVGGLSTKLNISVPKLTVNWGEVSALGKTFKYPKSFSVKFAANGGIFDQGSLIWAGERGPEVMATAAGGKTGVMNVQQMQDAVYEGVYAAVSAAMRGMSGGGSQDVRVYLDGREISSSVKKHQHESGATIMGNEVYSY